MDSSLARSPVLSDAQVGDVWPLYAQAWARRTRFEGSRRPAAAQTKSLRRLVVGTAFINDASGIHHQGGLWWVGTQAHLIELWDHAWNVPVRSSMLLRGEREYLTAVARKAPSGSPISRYALPQREVPFCMWRSFQCSRRSVLVLPLHLQTEALPRMFTPGGCWWKTSTQESAQPETSPPCCLPACLPACLPPCSQLSRRNRGKIGCSTSGWSVGNSAS